LPVVHRTATAILLKHVGAGPISVPRL
jgi:hypothetical protein